MRKTLCLALFCLLTISLADDCNNPLLKTLNLKNEGSSASGGGLKFCKSLQRGQTCCSADTVASIQDKINTLTDKLKTAVITRDKTITEVRDQIIPNFGASLKAFEDSVTKMAADPKYAVLAGMSGMGTSFNEALKQMSAGSAGLKKVFGDYQKSRTSCVVEVLKLQSAAYCLACDPAYASKGVTASGDITLSDKVCKRLGSACFPFMTASAAQSELLKVQSLVGVLNGMSSALTKIAEGGDVMTGFGAMMSAMGALTGSSGLGGSSNPEPTSPVSLPKGCTSADQCPWLCSSLLPKGQLQENLLVIGGNVDTSLVSSGGRLLEEEEEEVSVVKSQLAKNRRLATNEWDPESDEAGVSVTFQDDPAGVKPADEAYGSRIGSGFICMIALLVAYLF